MALFLFCEINSIIYFLEGDKSYKDYLAVRDLLVTHYGEPFSTISVEEVKEQNSGWPVDLWLESVYTSEDERVVVDLESKFKKGWIVLNLIKTPEKK